MSNTPHIDSCNNAPERDLPLACDPTPMTGPAEGDEYYDARDDKWFLFDGGKWIDNTEESGEELKTAAQIAAKQGNPTTKELLEKRKERHAHVKRHALTGLIVLVLTVILDVAITHYLISHQKEIKAALPEAARPFMPGPRRVTVIWPNGTTEEHVISETKTLPVVNEPVYIGCADDGTVVWKTVK